MDEGLVKGLGCEKKEQVSSEKDKLIESLRQQIKEKDKELTDLKTEVEQPWDMEAEDVFKFRASTWPSTLKFLKRNLTDLKKISMYLFGKELEMAPEILSRLSFRTEHFSVRDLINVRNLLVRMNILVGNKFRRAYDRYSCLKDFDRKCFSFDLNATICKTDTAELDKLLSQGSNLSRSMMYISDIHDKFSPSNKRYLPYLTLAVEVLEYTCRFVNTLGFKKIKCVQDRQFKIEFDSKSYLSYPTGALMVKDKVKMVVCFKDNSLLPPEMVEDPNNIILDMESLNADLEQLVTHMILLECPRGAVTDVKTSMYLELDLEAIAKIMESGNSNGKPKLPFKIWSTNIGAIDPSSNESWFSWVLRCFKDEDQKLMKKLKHFYFRNYLADKMYLSPDFNLIKSRIEIDYKNISVIQAGHCGKQIFKVPASAVASSKLGLKSHEELVVKIIDGKTAKKRWPRKSRWQPEFRTPERQYASERACIEILGKDPDFNHCFINSSGVSATINTPIGHFSGDCILSKYIETAPLPDDEETYEKVLNQIKILNKHRIYHKKLAEDNVVYGKDDRVYIMGFTSAEMIDPKQEADYWLDDEWLKKTFPRFHGKKARR